MSGHLLIDEVPLYVRSFALTGRTGADLLAVRQAGAVLPTETASAVLAERDPRPAAGTKTSPDLTGSNHRTPPI